MLFRQIPNSHKKRRAQLLKRRAAKREMAEVSDEEPYKPKRVPKPKPSHRTKPPRSKPSAPRLALQSRFVTVPRQYVKKARVEALSAPLRRPLQDDSAVFSPLLVTDPNAADLCLPARPPFEPGQTKSQVEQNEENKFSTWLAETERTIATWVKGEMDGNSAWTHSPTWYETNLEVWRQLWRVVESSSIILLLMDARCPAVHCPPSLRNYIRSLVPKRQVILILTKADLVDFTALEAWKMWLRNWWGEGSADDVQVVAANSYSTDNTAGRPRPELPFAAKSALVEALKMSHSHLRRDPSWRSVRSEVHWDDLEADEAECSTGEPLTVGLVGQPNVGKSSLINALLGGSRVSTSRTPGKTKHFQTIFWGARREIKLVDCPGLVCPSLIPMELQVMTGGELHPQFPNSVLPISRIAPIPSCVQYAAQLMPLEDIFQIHAQSNAIDDMDAKKTWRGSQPVMLKKQHQWTTGMILEQRAKDRGYFTSMGARPDTNRAGNELLRALAEGRVKWGFWPPDSTPARRGQGVWLGHSRHESHLGGYPEDTPESGSDEEKPCSAETFDDLSDSVEEDDWSEDDGFISDNNRSFFAALENFGDSGDESIDN